MTGRIARTAMRPFAKGIKKREVEKMVGNGSRLTAPSESIIQYAFELDITVFKTKNDKIMNKKEPPPGETGGSSYAGIALCSSLTRQRVSTIRQLRKGPLV